MGPQFALQQMDTGVKERSQIWAWVCLLSLALLLSVSSAQETVDVPIRRRVATYYLDSIDGLDSHSGLSQGTPWRSLAKASSVGLKAGDTLRLKRGSTFRGSLTLEANGTVKQPIVIEAYGTGEAPIIDSAGFLAGVYILNSHHLIVMNLEILADGGLPLDGSDPQKRYGVYVRATDDRAISHVRLQNLFIHDVYPAEGSELGGRNPTSYAGTAIAIHGNGEACTDFLVRDCTIERTGFKAIELKKIQEVEVLDNQMKDIGGPAIQPSRVDDLLVRGNTVDGSGAYVDPRMHGRGSGIWPWSSKRVLIEHNRFMHARGKADSCGMHIDFNCRDVVVQYNVSYDNEGGFVEILGNNHNCTYRYNISINDGARVKGRKGAHQDGRILWTSGYVGKNNPRNGPFNSYIYNNTIYVGPDSRSCFSIASTTEGLLVANNIFHIMGETKNISGNQENLIPRSLIQNNLYLNASVLPPNLPIEELDMIVGDPQFINPGGLEIVDYIPTNKSLITDMGIPIPLLDGDSIGLKLGLEVAKDILGNPIQGQPDMGAIEVYDRRRPP